MEVTLAGILRRAVARYHPRVALQARHTTWTYRDIDLESDALAAGLTSLGVSSGDCVALYLRNCAEYVIADLALLKVGAVKVPLNEYQSTSEVTYVLNDTGAHTLVAHQSLLNSLGSEAAPPAAALNEAMVVGDDGLVAINPDLAITAFYDDCEPADAEAAVARLRPQLLDGFPTLETAPPWQHVPATYVICQDDRALHPELQRSFAKQASSVAEWDGAHSPFLSQPQQVIDLLKRLAS